MELITIIGIGAAIGATAGGTWAYFSRRGVVKENGRVEPTVEWPRNERQQYAQRPARGGNASMRNPDSQRNRIEEVMVAQDRKRAEDRKNAIEEEARRRSQHDQNNQAQMTAMTSQQHAVPSRHDAVPCSSYDDSSSRSSGGYSGGCSGSSNSSCGGSSSSDSSSSSSCSGSSD